MIEPPFKLIVASTFAQARIVAERCGFHHREWKHAPDVHSLRGYGPECQFIQVEPVLLSAGSIPSRKFYEALVYLKQLQDRGASIELVYT